ncbi:MAG: hypothetical protein ACJAWF_003264 [Candidatus Azotimanducaceae bacterium]|jgi:hypothetical protein
MVKQLIFKLMMAALLIHWFRIHQERCGRRVASL